MRTADIQRFRVILRKFERVSGSHVKDCCGGLTPHQCHVLLEVERKNGATASDISKHLGFDKSKLSRLVDELVNLGLVDRRPHAPDRRYIVLKPTRDGKATCDSINSQADAYLREVFRAIPAEEHKQILHMFSKLVEAFTDFEKRKRTATLSRAGTCIV